jgi:hypothetical protein
MVEQDHRGIKEVTKVMTGFKSFEAVKATNYAQKVLNGIF